MFLLFYLITLFWGPAYYLNMFPTSVRFVGYNLTVWHHCYLYNCWLKSILPSVYVCLHRKFQVPRPRVFLLMWKNFLHSSSFVVLHSAKELTKKQVLLVYHLPWNSVHPPYRYYVFLKLKVWLWGDRLWHKVNSWLCGSW